MIFLTENRFSINNQFEHLTSCITQNTFVCLNEKVVFFWLNLKNFDRFLDILSLICYELIHSLCQFLNDGYAIFLIYLESWIAHFPTLATGLNSKNSNLLNPQMKSVDIHPMRIDKWSYGSSFRTFGWVVLSRMYI